MLHRAATVAAVMVGTGAGRPLRPLTIHLDFGIVEFALLGQAGEVDTRDELVREEKRYRFSEARMEPSTFDTTTVTHPGEGLRYREGLGRHRTRFLVVPVAVPVGSSRA